MILLGVLSLLWAGIPPGSLQQPPEVDELLEWLEHSNELGRKPEKVEVVDRRELIWPVGDHAGKKTNTFLIRYSFKQPDGVEHSSIGIAGPLNWSWIWDEFQNQLPPEDVYGRYAAWDMRMEKLIAEHDVPSPAQLEALAVRWRGPALTQVRFRQAWDVKTSAAAPAQLVGLAGARCGTEEGFAVFDGASSLFYPRALLPDGLWYGHVLPAHVGRRTLGLAESKERERWKRAWKPAANVEAQVEFVRATIKSVQAGKEKLPEPTYAQFPAALEATGIWLNERGRIREFNEILDVVEKQWKPQFQWNERLGCAAHKAGLHERAAIWLDDYLKENRYGGRGEEASLLARSLVKIGKPAEARAALTRSMKSGRKEFNEKDARGHLGTQCQFEDWYQGFRSTYLELFGPGASKELEKDGLPESLLPPPINIPARE